MDDLARSGCSRPGRYILIQTLTHGRAPAGSSNSPSILSISRKRNIGAKDLFNLTCRAWLPVPHSAFAVVDDASYIKMRSSVMERSGYNKLAH
jgi:hypothetical protein